MSVTNKIGQNGFDDIFVRDSTEKLAFLGVNYLFYKSFVKIMKFVSFLFIWSIFFQKLQL